MFSFLDLRTKCSSCQKVRQRRLNADHLNTPRLVANQSGQTVWRWDQMGPFGVNVLLDLLQAPPRLFFAERASEQVRGNKKEWDGNLDTLCEPATVDKLCRFQITVVGPSR